MPRKQEPRIIDVLDYFEHAPLEAAKLALQLATRAVRLREPAKKADKKPVNATSPTAATPAPAADKGSRARTTQAPPVGQPVSPSATGSVPVPVV